MEIINLYTSIVSSFAFGNKPDQTTVAARFNGKVIQMARFQIAEMVFVRYRIEVIGL